VILRSYYLHHHEAMVVPMASHWHPVPPAAFSPGWTGVAAKPPISATVNALHCGFPEASPAASPGSHVCRQLSIGRHRRPLAVTSCQVEPGDPYEDKARHLRELYRSGGERGYPDVRREYERLFPDYEVELDRILMSAWREARELAGWSYDMDAQRLAEGRRSVVTKKMAWNIGGTDVIIAVQTLREAEEARRRSKLIEFFNRGARPDHRQPDD
jgi:hypothetical protein